MPEHRQGSELLGRLTADHLRKAEDIGRQVAERVTGEAGEGLGEVRGQGRWLSMQVWTVGILRQ